MGSEFDRFKDSYQDEVQGSISFIGQGVDFFAEAKVRHLLRRIEQAFGAGRLSELSVLDVGCGVGLMDRILGKRFASLTGVDVSEGSLESARKANPDFNYLPYGGKTLPFPEGAFDVAFAINVFHHVPPPDRDGLVAELFRVTKPGGLSLIFEHNPINPLTRLAVSRCEFDQDAVLLRPAEVRRLFRGAGFILGRRDYIVFFPWKGKWLDRIEDRLGWLPMGAQYVVSGRRRPPTAAGA